MYQMELVFEAMKYTLVFSGVISLIVTGVFYSIYLLVTTIEKLGKPPDDEDNNWPPRNSGGPPLLEAFDYFAKNRYNSPDYEE